MTAAGAAIQLVPAGNTAAATTKKSILIKAPSGTKVTAHASQPSPQEVPKLAKSSTKLQPGIIRMAGPRAAAPAVTKVDVGTSITPVKTPTVSASASVTSSAVSRRLDLPEEEPGALASVAMATVAKPVDEEVDEVSLECQEVFDDSFEKSSDEPAKESGDNPPKKGGEPVGSAAGQPEAVVDLLKPLPEPGAEPEGSLARVTPPLQLRTNEFGLVEVVTASRDNIGSSSHLRVRFFLKNRRGK